MPDWKQAGESIRGREIVIIEKRRFYVKGTKEIVEKRHRAERRLFCFKERRAL